MGWLLDGTACINKNKNPCCFFKQPLLQELTPSTRGSPSYATDMKSGHVGFNVRARKSWRSCTFLRKSLNLNRHLDENVEVLLVDVNIWNIYMLLPPVGGNILELILNFHPQPGGLRHASASISGPQSYKRMKFEAGVHRVQRVPKTEKQGRMHTSTMTVAVLPQPTEVQLYMIDPWHR